MIYKTKHLGLKYVTIIKFKLCKSKIIRKSHIVVLEYIANSLRYYEVTIFTYFRCVIYVVGIKNSGSLFLNQAHTSHMHA